MFSSVSCRFQQQKSAPTLCVHRFNKVVFITDGRVSQPTTQVSRRYRVTRIQVSLRVVDLQLGRVHVVAPLLYSIGSIQRATLGSVDLPHLALHSATGLDTPFPCHARYRCGPTQKEDPHVSAERTQCSEHCTHRTAGVACPPSKTPGT